MRPIIFFVIILLILPLVVSASEEKIFSGWKYPGDSITANDLVFSFRFLEDPDRMRIRYGDYYKTIDEGECDVLKGTNSTIKACYEEYEYDIKKGAFKAYLLLYLREPEIDIDRVFEETDIIVGDEIEVNVIISNTGSSTAYDLEYIDTLEDFEILQCKGCFIESNSVLWSKAAIDDGDSYEFSYMIKPNHEFKRKIAAVLNYNTLRTSEEIVTKPVEITAENILDIKTKLVDVEYFASEYDNIIDSGKNHKIRTNFGTRDILGKALEKVHIGEDFKMIVELTNNKFEEDSIKINNLEIRIPTNIMDIHESSVRIYYNKSKNKSVGSIGLQQISPNLFKWSGNLENYRKYFILDMTAVLTGHPSIYTSADFAYKGESFKIDDIKETIELVNISPVVTIAFEKRDPGTRYYTRTDYLDKRYETESGKKEVMKVRVNNPSNNIILKNIDIILHSDMLEDDITYHIDYIPKSGSILVDTRELIMPELKRDKTYKFWINTSWLTEFGERIEESIDKEIRVEAIKDLKIGHKFSKSTVESGEEFYVTTNLQNTRQNSLLNVSASDNIGDFIFKGGINSQKTEIKPDIKIDAYKYELIAPHVRNNTKKCINTTVTYFSEQSAYNVSEEACITVKPKKIDLRIDKKIDDSEIYIGEFFDIDYTIRNNDEETAIDIWFSLPLQSNIDIVSNFDPISTERLDDGEVWNAKKEFRVRAKEEGKISLKPITLFYSDLYGNEFNKTDKKRIVTIEHQNLNSPVLMINKTTARDSLMSNESLEVMLVVENIGSGFAKNITIWDNTNEWKIPEIGMHSKKIILYNMTFDNLGENNLSNARMKYSDGLWEYQTASDPVTVEVFMPFNEEIEYTIVQEETEKPEKEKINIIQKIIDYFKEILFWTKEG